MRHPREWPLRWTLPMMVILVALLIMTISLLNTVRQAELNLVRTTEAHGREDVARLTRLAESDLENRPDMIEREIMLQASDLDVQTSALIRSDGLIRFSQRSDWAGRQAAVVWTDWDAQRFERLTAGSAAEVNWNPSTHVLRIEMPFLESRAGARPVRGIILVEYQIEASLSALRRQLLLHRLPELGLALVFAGLLALVLRLGVARPLAQLAALATRVGHGEFEGPPTAQGLGELRQLALSLNVMALQIRGSQQQLQQRSRALLAVEESNSLLVRATDEPALLQGICQLLVDRGGYRMVWVGMALDDTEHSVQVGASAGVEDGYLARATFSWGHGPESHGATATAIREQRVVVVQDTQTDPVYAGWHDAARDRHYATSIALPLLPQAGVCLGALSLYSSRPGAFDAEEIELLQGLANDLAFGLRSLRDRSAREQAERAAALSEQRLRGVLSTSPAIFFAREYFYGALVPRQISDNVERILGYPPQDAMRLGWWEERVHPDDLRGVLEAHRRLDQEDEVTHEYRFFRCSGEQVWLREVARLARDVAGQPAELVTVWLDITSHKDDQAMLLRLSQAVQQSPLSIVITTLDGRYDYVNDYFIRNTGYRTDEVIGRSPALLHSGKTPAQTTAALWRTLQQGLTWEGDFVNRRKDGTEYVEHAVIAPIRRPDGVVSHYLSVQQDITEARKAQAEIHRLAYFDSLTGLPNRESLHQHVSELIAAATPDAAPCHALVMLNLDRFKAVIDARGHSLGDALLRAVGQRISERVQGRAQVSRLSGDEFGVLFARFDAGDDQSRALQRETEGLRAAFESPFVFASESVNITASFGACVFPIARSDLPNAVLRRASTALHRAKAGGGNQIALFTAAMEQSVSARFLLEQELRQGIARGELVMYVQSQVDGTGRTIGAEALVRWQHPQHGLVGPGQFIGLAEDSGLIVPLGNWMLREACDLIARLQAVGSDIRISVNVSARQFHQIGFVDGVQATLARSGARAELLTLEITESLLVDDMAETIRRMQALVDRGVSFSIDDFGTGYSSLAYLRRLPIRELKIDRSFVTDAPTRADDAALVDVIISLAHHLDLHVVAEGVETVEQAEFLRQRHCESMQGYLFARPQPAGQWLERVLRERA